MRRLRKRYHALVLASGLFLLPTAGIAAESDIQLWPVLTLNHGLGSRWGAHLQTRARFDNGVSETKDFLLRPFVSWRPLDSITLDLGYDYLHSYTSSSENRIWQAAQHHLEWRGFTLQNRIRFDQRWVEGVDGVVVRFRYRLRAMHPIGKSSWYVALSDAVFANLNDEGEGPVYGFEQNRLRFALGAQFFERLRVEGGYEYQYVTSRSGDTNTHTFVIEVSLDTGDRPIVPWSPR